MYPEQVLAAALPHTATDRRNIGQCLPGSPASCLTDLTVAASSKRHNQSPAIVHGGHFRKSPRQRRKALGRPGRYSEELSVPRSSTFSAHSTLLPKPAVSLQLSSALQSHAVALKLFGNPTSSPCAMSAPPESKAPLQSVCPSGVSAARVAIAGRQQGPQLQLVLVRHPVPLPGVAAASGGLRLHPR